MRAGLVFSAVGHLALLVWGFVLFASPKQFAPIPPESITVDIVPAAAMAQGSEEQPRAESAAAQPQRAPRSEEHTSELQSRRDLVCRLLLEKKKTKKKDQKHNKQKDKKKPT